MRSTELREAKAELRRWFASQPTEYLTRVVDECREGRFAFSAQCHCVRGLCDGGYYENITHAHLRAERALAMLAGLPPFEHTIEGWVPVLPAYCAYSIDVLARARTLPIVLAEIRRRNRVRVPEAVEVLR